MMIAAENLWKRYGRTEALKGATFSVPQGSAFALIGENGAGKTTTIRLLMNLISAAKGRACLLGVDSRNLSPAELRQIGYVAEATEFPGRMTVGDYLDYLRPLYPAWDPTLEASLRERFRLPRDRPIAALSHGMRMKFAFATVLPYRPKLLILDEPFAGIDPLVRDELMEGLLGEGGDTTLFISSHDLADIEGLVTHVGYLEQGRLLFQESMEELSARVRQVRVTLDRTDGSTARPLPVEWLNASTSGNVVTFVDTRYREAELGPMVTAQWGPFARIEAEALNLRGMFTALARASQRAET
jgi:ABC-2 type transport system ATP-binding protein